MSKTKNIVTIVLIFMMAMITLPMAIGEDVTSLTFTVSIPEPHNTNHTPFITDTWWVNTGTIGTPAWTGQGWGDTTTVTVTHPVYGEIYDVKIPALILDSQANTLGNGYAHTFKVDVADICAQAVAQGAGLCMLVAAETAHNPPDVPTYRFFIDPPDLDIEVKGKRAGPQTDVLRQPVIKGPDPTLLAMQGGTAHVATDLIRTGDVEKLAGDGFTITYDAGFHMGFIGFNIRDIDFINDYYRTDVDYWPLNDVQFRHAMIHCYDQQTIVAAIYGYTVTPVQSLVPPSQGGWQYTQQRQHPFNPGSPLATTVYNPTTKENEDSCSILRYAGYEFVDAGTTGVVDDADYWLMPNDDPMPRLKMYTPTYETAPTSAEHGARFVADLGEIGLAATGGNGYKGIEHEPSDFNWYMDERVDYGLFDMYMVFWSLSRFPDHIYDMLHSSMECVQNPGMINHPGVDDPTIDELVTIVKTGLIHSEKLAACHEIQRLLYEPEECPVALPYMLLYSRIYFNGFDANLRGIVKSPGYGADNSWTNLNMHWESGTEVYTPSGRTVVDWVCGEELEILNPLYASTVYSWQVMGWTQDSLMAVNPYTHEDLPWMAVDWELEEWPNQGPGNDETWQNITYYLRKDVFWQDGNPFVAEDCKFNWLFQKNNNIPRYTATWKFIDDVEVIDDYTVKVICNVTSQFLLYDLAGIAALLPPPVWEHLDGRPQAEVLGYQPELNTTKPTDAGPWFGTEQGPKTQLYGTGPWIFDYYDELNMVSEIHQNPSYFMLADEVSDMKTAMFHRCGDVNYDGTVWSDDTGVMGLKFGMMNGIDPEYDADVDVNSDDIIDMVDISLANYFFGEQKEHP